MNTLKGKRTINRGNGKCWACELASSHSNCCTFPINIHTVLDHASHSFLHIFFFTLQFNVNVEYAQWLLFVITKIWVSIDTSQYNSNYTQTRNMKKSKWKWRIRRYLMSYELLCLIINLCFMTDKLSHPLTTDIIVVNTNRKFF